MGLLSAAVELGIRHFDVARSYGSGDAEAILGDFLTTTNEPCTVISKCGIAPAATYGLSGRRTKALARAALRKVPGPYRALRSRATASVQGGQFGPEQIRRSLETSLRALRRDRLEAFLLHECTPEEWASGSVQEVLSDLVGSGAIGCAGPATSAAGTLEILGHESIAVPLVQFHDDGEHVRRRGDRARSTPWNEHDHPRGPRPEPEGVAGSPCRSERSGAAGVVGPARWRGDRRERARRAAPAPCHGPQPRWRRALPDQRRRPSPLDGRGRQDRHGGRPAAGARGADRPGVCQPAGLSQVLASRRRNQPPLLGHY